jgi:hypothetical protein
MVCKLAMILLASEETPDDISTPFTDRVQWLESRPWTITGELLSYARSIIDDEFTRLQEVLSLMGATTDTVRIQRVTDWLQRRGWTKHSEWMRRLAEYWPLTASKVSDQLLETKVVIRQHRKGAKGPGTWFYKTAVEGDDEATSTTPTTTSTRTAPGLGRPSVAEAS